MYEQEEDKKTCLECGREIYGRKDKKFCCEGCKNSYHNRNSRGTRRLKERIITDLNSNYRILDGLLEIGMKSISTYDAETIGLKPSVITGYSKTNGHNQMRCFDICYCQSPTRIFNIHRTSLEETRQSHRCQTLPTCDKSH